jgi:hypothetical protein
MTDLQNNTKHGSIKMTRVEASVPDNKSPVYLNLYDDVIHDNHEWLKPKVSVGDRVRITNKHLRYLRIYT